MSGVAEKSLPMATWRNIVIVIDNGRAPAHAYAAHGAEMDRLAERYPGNLGRMVVIPADASPPTDEARRAINAILERHAHSLKSVVCVVEGTGFQSAVVRATLTTMTFTLRKMRGWKVVGHADEGLALLVARTSSPSELETIDLEPGRRALAALRSPAAAAQSTAAGA